MAVSNPPQGSVPPQNQPGAPRRLKKLERQQQALEYRLLGATYAQIGEKLGVARVTAFHYVREYIQKTCAQTAETGADSETAARADQKDDFMAQRAGGRRSCLTPAQGSGVISWSGEPSKMEKLPAGTDG
jgi:hypothetical protein